MTLTKNICIISLLFSIAITTISCTSFSKSAFKNDMVSLTENNIEQLNGSFTNHPIQVYEKQNKTWINTKKINVYNLFGSNFIPDKLDSLAITKSEEHIEITFTNKNAIEVKYVINKKTVSKTNIKGQIKKGFFYVDKKSEYWGIPLLFGGYKIEKQRISISKRGNMIINTLYDKGGGILFIFSNGSGNNTSFEIEKTR